MLIIRVITFDLTQPIGLQIINVTLLTDRQTDGRTDNLRQQYRALHNVHRAVKSPLRMLRVT